MLARRPLSLAVVVLPGCALVAGVDFDAVHPRETTGAGGSGGGMTCNTGCSDCIVYVSLLGSDALDGCSPETAKQSFNGALSKIVTEGLIGHEIHACKGSYPESLTITAPITIRGGHDCATFSDKAPELNETILAGDGGETTLTITGAAADASTTIDRLTVVGASGVQGTSTAVVIRNGAQPVLRNSTFRGGDGTGVAYGSVGVWIDQGAGPVLENNNIEGGSGSSDGVGSVGVVADDVSSSFGLTGNTIVGGSGIGGVNGIGSCGARISNATITVSGNIFRSESGSGPDGVFTGIGVFLTDNASVELSNNWIFGGDATCAKPPCFQAALAVMTPQPTMVKQNRIYGGRAQGDVTQAGIWLENAADITIENNFIHGGDSANTTRAINVLGGSGGARIRYNTVFSGGGAVNTAIVIDPASVGIAIDGNLIGGYGANPFAITATCSSLASLKNNAFVDFATTGLAACPTVVPTVPDLEMAVGTTKASDNIQLQETCAQEPWCVQVPACASACFPGLFKAFSDPLGQAELALEGWRLAQSVPCAITGGGGNGGPLIDHYGTDRDTPLSIGAEETSSCM